MRISDWSSDVCSSDLAAVARRHDRSIRRPRGFVRRSTDRCCHGPYPHPRFLCVLFHDLAQVGEEFEVAFVLCNLSLGDRRVLEERTRSKSEEHTSELQSLMRNSYADFCLKKKKKN